MLDCQEPRVTATLSCGTGRNSTQLESSSQLSDGVALSIQAFANRERSGVALLLGASMTRLEDGSIVGLPPYDMQKRRDRDDVEEVC